MLAARFLDVHNFGMFSSLLAVIGILSKIVDFGIEPIVFREFSRDKDNFHLFNSALNLRFAIYVILVLIFNLCAPFLQYSSKEIILSNILFTTIVFSMKTVNVRELLSTPFKVNLKMHYPMTLSILDNLILLVMILLLPFVNDTLMYFVIVYACSNVPGFVLSFYYLKKKFGYRYQFTIDKGIWLLKESLPLFGFVILNAVFVQIDIVILNYYRGAYDVGIYSVGTRLTMPLNIIPGAIVTTVFPILVKKMSDKVSSDYLSNLVVKLLYVIAFVIASVFTFESGALTNLIFGQKYAASALPASVLYWCQIFLFFTYYTLVVLIAKDKQFYNFIYAAIQVVVNVGLNFILIPQYSFLGAALAKLAASFASFVFIVFILNRFGYKPSVGRYKVLAWSIILCVNLYVLSFLPVIPYLLLSPFLIIIITFTTRLFGKDELIIFFRLLNREEFGKVLIDKYHLA